VNGLLTARTSRGLAFLTVLGVFPRNFPGVLNISATFLNPDISLGLKGMVVYSHLVLVEDLSHMLIQPFCLIPRRE